MEAWRGREGGEGWCVARLRSGGGGSERIYERERRHGGGVVSSMRWDSEEYIVREM